MSARLGVGAVGVLLGLYGAWLVLSRGHDFVSTGLWLAGGVVLHDGVLSLVVLALGGLLLPLLPRVARAPVVVGSVVLGTVTLMAVPVLGRFGARPDNATLLDRSYGVGWLVLAGLVVLAVVVAVVVRVRRTPDRP